MKHPSPNSFKLKTETHAISEYKMLIKHTRIKTHIMFNYGLFQDLKQGFQVISTSQVF